MHRSLMFVAYCVFLEFCVLGVLSVLLFAVLKHTPHRGIGVEGLNYVAASRYKVKDDHKNAFCRFIQNTP